MAFEFSVSVEKLEKPPRWRELAGNVSYEGKEVKRWMKAGYKYALTVFAGSGSSGYIQKYGMWLFKNGNDANAWRHKIYQTAHKYLPEGETYSKTKLEAVLDTLHAKRVD